MTNDEIRAMLIRRREQQGWSTWDLSRAAGIREAHIRRWEQGPRPPSNYMYMLRWGMALGLDRDEVPIMDRESL